MLEGNLVEAVEFLDLSALVLRGTLSYFLIFKQVGL